MTKRKAKDDPIRDILKKGADEERRLLKRERRAERELAELRAELAELRRTLDAVRSA